MPRHFTSSSNLPVRACNRVSQAILDNDCGESFPLVMGPLVSLCLGALLAGLGAPALALLVAILGIALIPAHLTWSRLCAVPASSVSARHLVDVDDALARLEAAYAELPGDHVDALRAARSLRAGILKDAETEYRELRAAGKLMGFSGYSRASLIDGARPSDYRSFRELPESRRRLVDEHTEIARSARDRVAADAQRLADLAGAAEYASSAITAADAARARTLELDPSRIETRRVVADQHALLTELARESVRIQRELEATYPLPRS